jgi:sorting nexin-5/6/32
MHEVFLQRLAAHPILRNDNNFRVFLEYKEDVKIFLLKFIILIFEFFS